MSLKLKKRTSFVTQMCPVTTGRHTTLEMIELSVKLDKLCL